MKQMVPELYSDYGRYINEFRSFPSILDGCKIVERRLLYCVYLVAKDKKVKAARVVGDCIGRFHPHGDTSAYGSLVGLVQNDFVTGQGNWGNNMGITPSPAAAMRYTECRADKEMLKLAFEYINEIPKQVKELEEEPSFIPTKLPICLLGNSFTQGIGFGYKTLIPCYEKKDLIKRLKWLLNDKKGKEPIIVPKSNCTVTSPDVDLKNLLIKGKQKIEFKGTYSIDSQNNSIIIHSLPPNKSFTTFLKKFEKEIQIEKSLGFVDESAKGETNVRLKILRQRGYKISKLQTKIDKEITGSVSFECNMVNMKGKVVLSSIDEMIITIYNIYKKVIESVIKKEIKDIDDKITELNIIKRVRPHLSEELKKNPDNEEKMINNISTVINISKNILKEIFNKYTIGRIFRIKTETSDLQLKKKSKEDDLNNLIEYVWKNKYL